MFISIIIFLVVAGGLALVVNLVLPALWYRFRLRRRRRWAWENGLQPCEPSGAAPLAAVTLPVFTAKSGKVLSCLSRGPLTLIDYAYTQSLGGEPTESVDVRRAMTAVLVELSRHAPMVAVRPQVGRVPRFLLNQAARTGGHRRSIIDAVIASNQTGDDAFDSVFRVLGDDESEVRAFLGPAARALMLANRRFSYEIGGRHAVVYASGLVFGNELDRLIEAADKLRTELR